MRYPGITDEEIAERYERMPDYHKTPFSSSGQVSLFDEPKAKTNPRDHWRIRPTNLAPIIRAVDGEPEFQLARWGFDFKHVPGIGNPSVNNTRDDKMTQPRSVWGKSWRERRCLIPASGFYEFKRVMVEGRKTPKETIPHAITMAGGEGMMIGGIWIDSESTGLCYSMVTTTPNAAMAEVHDRMPVILDPHDWDEWLLGEDPPEHLIQSWPGELSVRKCESPLRKTWTPGPPTFA